MKIGCIDLYNLIIRYFPYKDQDIDEDIDTSLQILTKLIDLSDKFDLVILVSDER